MAKSRRAFAGSTGSPLMKAIAVGPLSVPSNTSMPPTIGRMEPDEPMPVRIARLRAEIAADPAAIGRLRRDEVVDAGVPQLGPAQDDVVRRFVSLVDELYDRNVKLLIQAAVPLEALYDGGSLSFVFERTRSRLLEMQSHEYLARGHRP